MKRLFKLMTIGFLVALVVGVASVAYGWSALDLPPEAPLSQTTFVTDAQGNDLATFNAGENRVPVEFDAIPQVLSDAVIATEDRGFYDHKGVDPRGIARALVVDIRDGGVTQGGSTLSQQYVKTVFVGADRTAVRKFKEAILAVKLEQRHSKDEILSRYLNAIYFGRGVYGVQAASKAYFNKDVQDLDLREATYLAGLIRAPELADAAEAPDTANQRRNTTLDSMVITGAITPAQRDEIAAVPVSDYTVPPVEQDQTVESARANGSQYFVDYVKRILTQKYGEQTVQSGGLRVKTTLEPALQSRAYDSVYGFLKEGEPAGALVTVDADGAIKAMVGGRDWEQSQVNLAVGTEGGGSGRQGGSTFKPFTLAAAVEDDMCWRDMYTAPAEITLARADEGRDWTVSNYEDERYGRMNLVNATANSVNTVYAQLNEEVGPAATASIARKAGITSPVGANIANVLGTDAVSPLDMASSYMTFGRNGMYTAPNPVLEVRTADGDLLESFQPDQARAMQSNTAETVNMALQQVVQRGSGEDASVNGVQIAGKTGTTDDNTDAWFVGYTPELATAVWMGFPEGAVPMDDVRGRQVTGGSFPAQIFGDYMSEVVGNSDTDFSRPQDCRSNNGSDSGDDEEERTTTTTEAPDGQGGREEDDFERRLRNIFGDDEGNDGNSRENDERSSRGEQRGGQDNDETTSTTDSQGERRQTSSNNREE